MCLMIAFILVWLVMIFLYIYQMCDISVCDSSESVLSILVDDGYMIFSTDQLVGLGIVPEGNYCLISFHYLLISYFYYVSS